MSLTGRIAGLERDLANQRMRVAEEVARLRAIEAELGSLRSSRVTGDPLSEMTRTDAILAVLRAADGTLSPKEIRSRLTSAGRDDEMRSLTATLDYLVKKGSVSKAGRGQYLAA